MPAHDLNEKQAVVAICSIPNLVYGLDGGIDGRVEAYGEVGAVKIVIDGPR